MGRRGRHPDPKSKRSRAALAQVEALAKMGHAPKRQAAPEPTDLEVPASIAAAPLAVAFWNDHAPILAGDGRLRRELVESFGILCRLHADIVQLQDQLAAEGFITATDKGQAASPVARLLRDARRDFVQLAREFGMTAAAAARLPQEPAANASEEDDETALLRAYTPRGA